MEFFYVSFRKKIFILDSAILFWKKTKIFMETLLYREKATDIQGYGTKLCLWRPIGLFLHP